MPKLVSDKTGGREITITFTEAELATVVAALAVDAEYIEDNHDDDFEYVDDFELFNAMDQILRSTETGDE